MSLPAEDGRWLRVVEHDDHVVAIDDETGVTVEIAPVARVVHELPGDLLVHDVARTLGLDGDPERLAHRVWLLGRFVPISGERFPVYFAAGRDRDELAAMAGRVAARTAGPLILVTPTERWIGEEVRSLLRDRESVSVALEHLLEVTEEGLILSRPLRDSVAGFVRRHVPQAAGAVQQPRFPTPPGACWSDVKIRFLDGHTVSVSVGGVSRRYTYEEMGLGTANARKPTVQWDLLRAFAAGRGQLTWESHHASRHNQKRKERLAQRLQAFFGIDSDPFEYDDDLKGWRARFTIEPD